MVDGFVADSRISPRLRVDTGRGSTFVADGISPRLRVTTIPGVEAGVRTGFGVRGRVIRGGRVGQVPVVDRAEQAAQARRRAELAEATRLLTKARSTLLTPKEQVRLGTITQPISITRIQALAQPTGTFTREQLIQQRRQRQLAAQRQQVLSEQEKLNIRQQELQARLGVLRRLQEKEILTPGVAKKFNTQAEQLERDQKALLKKATVTEKKIISFKEGEPTRVDIGIPKTPEELLQTGLARELQKEKAKKKQIQRPFGLIDIAPTVLETEKVGREFGAFAVVPGAELLGAQVGGVVGRTIGGFESVAMLIAGRTRVGIERALGEPIAFDIPSESIIGRTIRGTQRIPILADITGAAQVKRVTKQALEVRAPALEAFAASGLLLFAPQIIGTGLRVAGRARVPIQSFFAEGFRVPGIRPTLRFTAPKPAVRTPSPEELEISAILRRRPRTFREIDELFAGIQKRPTEAELAKLLKKPPGVTTRPIGITPAGVEFGALPRVRPKTAQEILKEIIPPAVKKKPKRTIVLRFPELGEVGGLPTKRPRPGLTVQIPTAEFLKPIRLPVGRRIVQRVRVVRFEDLFKQFRVQPKATITPRILRVPATITAIFPGLKTATLSAQQLFGAQLSLEGLREFEFIRQRDLATQRFAELTATSTLTRTLEAQRTAEAQRTRERLRERIRTRTRTRTPLLFRIRAPREVLRPRKPRQPKRPRVVLFPLPSLDTPQFRAPADDPTKGFNVFIRRKGKLIRQNKVPLTRPSAFGLGFLLADESVGRSGVVREAKKKGKSIPALNAITGRAFKFRKPKGKTKLARDSFVERSRFAIDSLGELQGITARGRAKAERNRAIRKVLRIRPKKRKKKIKRRRK